jgi:polygalacturonase
MNRSFSRKMHCASALCCVVSFFLMTFTGCNKSPTSSSSDSSDSVLSDVESEDTSSESTSDSVSDTSISGDISNQKTDTKGNNKTTNTSSSTTTTTSNTVSGIKAAFPINVKELNVKGDGATDDTAAIQQIINTLSERTTIYFPAGTYKITKPIVLKKNLCLVGEPSSNGVGGSTIIAGKSMDDMFTYTDSYAQGAWFYNLTFDGGSSNGSVVGAALNLSSAIGARVYNCKFQNITNEGIYVERTPKNQYVWVNLYEYLDFANVKGYAINMINSDSYLNTINVNGGKGILDFEHGGTVYNNITVTNSTGSGLTIGREERSEVCNVCITNSTFTNNAQYGIHFSSNPSSPLIKQSTVDNCELSGNKTADIRLTAMKDLTVYNSNLRSSSPVETSSSTDGIAFVNNNMAVSSFAPQGKDIGLSDNKTGVSSFPSKGALNKDENSAKARYIALGSSNFVSLTSVGGNASATVDNSAAFKKAFDLLPNGGTVYLPYGDYGLSSTVTVPSNITLIGAYETKIVASGNLDTMFLVKSAKNVKFYNLILDNSRKKAMTNGIRFENSSTCQVDTVNTSETFYNAESALMIDASCTNLLIKNCYFKSPNDKTLITCKGSNVTIRETYFSHGSIGVLFMGGQNNKINNVHFDWYTISAIKFVNTSSAAMNHTVSNCYFDINKACLLFDFTSAYNAGVTVNSCTFRADGNMMVNGIVPPEIQINNGKNMKFYANVFEQGYSFRLKGSTDNIAIIGNTSVKDILSTDSDTPAAGCTISANVLA